MGVVAVGAAAVCAAFADDGASFFSVSDHGHSVRAHSRAPLPFAGHVPVDEYWHLPWGAGRRSLGTAGCRLLGMYPPSVEPERRGGKRLGDVQMDKGLVYADAANPRRPCQIDQPEP